MRGERYSYNECNSAISINAMLFPPLSFFPSYLRSGYEPARYKPFMIIPSYGNPGCCNHILSISHQIPFLSQKPSNSTRTPSSQAGQICKPWIQSNGFFHSHAPQCQSPAVEVEKKSIDLCRIKHSVFSSSLIIR